jgi:hypothetical protein
MLKKIKKKKEWRLVPKKNLMLQWKEETEYNLNLV